MDGPQLARVVEMALMGVTILLLVWAGVPETPPWRVIGRSLWAMVRSGRRILYVLACLSILAANYLYLELGVDDVCNEWIGAAGGRDYTAAVHRFEGEFVSRLQGALASPPLTWFLGFVYVVVFPCLVITLLFVFYHLRQRRGLAMLLIGYALNYLLALPFFLWFPLREVYHHYSYDLGSQGVRLLLDDIHPVVMEAYRLMSGLDNCFPSFHTSLGVTLALLAWHTGRTRFAWLMTFLGAANALSTLYLGIHWGIDVAGGLALALVAYGLARFLSRRWAEGPDAALSHD